MFEKRKKNKKKSYGGAKIAFRSSCQCTHGCCVLASWATQHTTVCLDIRHLNKKKFEIFLVGQAVLQMSQISRSCVINFHP